MAWFKVDDNFLMHPKTAMLSNDATAFVFRQIEVDVFGG